ncbi:MAG: phosphate signaling complex protein PhoU [Actinomycetota bacterium]|nr:phosphate signaling complex protein PhoU [Actinomycetota bacterium]
MSASSAETGPAEEPQMNEIRVEYHGELEELRSDLIRLGAMVSETIGRGTAALLDRDLHAAQLLIDGDDVIDDFCLGLEERCYRILALQSPIAGELRFVLTTLRLIGELERSADLIVNVCKASRRIYDVDFGPQIRGLIEQMGVEATFLIRAAIDSYVDSDTSLAAALDDIDDRLDELQTAYVQAIFQSHSEMNLNLQGAVQMAMIGRYYERVGDHAVNIGERVMYMVTGWLPEKTGSARQRLREAEAAERGDTPPESPHPTILPSGEPGTDDGTP